MPQSTLFLLIIAGAISLALAIFMYGFRSKQRGPLRYVFGALRFLTLFSVLLLLINPKFKSERYTVEKPVLPVLLDNSASITALSQESAVEEVLAAFRQSDELQQRFDIRYFTFGNQLDEGDSLSYMEKNTNIAKALETLGEVYKNNIAPIVLVTDGNQTLGQDYEFTAPQAQQPIFPVVLGDSTQYIDLQLSQLNTNRYAFLKNQFPVEVFLKYSGDETVSTEFTVRQANSVVFSQAVSFSQNNKTQSLSFTLPASKVGIQKYTATVRPLSDEKNTSNNSKQFAVEVIDQATKVLIVSELLHPDLGALKKSITTNEQRTVTIAKPSDALGMLNEYQLIVLYQPNRSFTGIFAELERSKNNYWLITGTETDWGFLNRSQNLYSKELTVQTEEVQAEVNPNYGSFAVTPLPFGSFPPLTTTFGSLTIAVPYELLLEQTVNGYLTENALLATTQLNGQRTAVWDGEGVWKWRSASFIDTGSFQDFDAFIGQLVQYVASKKQRSRLEVAHESFYYNNAPITIAAQYFDKNFVFDSRASLQITVTNVATGAQTVFPLLLKNNYYEVDLSSLPAGEYRFTVSATDEGLSRDGNFSILEFNVEQQFLNADIDKLQRVADNTEGTMFYSTQAESLLDTLLDDERFVAIQKSEVKTVPLIDWRYLLAFIAVTLSLEWFIRKYNGLI